MIKRVSCQESYNLFMHFFAVNRPLYLPSQKPVQANRQRKTREGGSPMPLSSEGHLGTKPGSLLSMLILRILILLILVVVVLLLTTTTTTTIIIIGTDRNEKELYLNILYYHCIIKH